MPAGSSSPLAPVWGRDERGGPYHEYRLSPDGRRVAAVVPVTGEFDGPCRLVVWDASTGQIIHRHQLPDRDWSIMDSWLPDGRTAVVWLKDGLIFVDAETAQIGVRIPVKNCSVTASTDGRLVATGDSDERGTIRVWGVASGGEVAVIRTGESVHRAFAFANGDRALVIANGRFLRMIDLVTWKEQGRRRLPDLGHASVADQPVSEVLTLPSGCHVLTPVEDGTACVGPAGVPAFPTCGKE